MSVHLATDDPAASVLCGELVADAEAEDRLVWRCVACNVGSACLWQLHEHIDWHREIEATSAGF